MLCAAISRLTAQHLLLPAGSDDERQRQQRKRKKAQHVPLDVGGGIARLHDKAAIAVPSAETRGGDEQQGGGAGFGPCTGGVQVLRDGTYFVAYTLNAPPLSQADTVMGLRLNGARLGESEAAVQLNGAGGAACFSGQTVVRAAAGSCISLVSNGAANFPQSATGVPLATMTIVGCGQ